MIFNFYDIGPTRSQWSEVADDNRPLPLLYLKRLRYVFPAGLIDSQPLALEAIVCMDCGIGVKTLICYALPYLFWMDKNMSQLSYHSCEHALAIMLWQEKQIGHFIPVYGGLVLVLVYKHHSLQVDKRYRKFRTMVHCG